VTDEAQARKASEDYWRVATHSYLGSSTYYDRRAAALEGVFSRVSDLGPVVDIGCGDGRFTRQAAEHFSDVTGRDISPALIEAARTHDSSVRFEVATTLDPLPTALGLVMALGMTSCLVDDTGFHQFLSDVASALQPGGSLVLVDSLSRGEDALTKFASGYVARYRDRSSYIAAIESVGLELVEEHDLGKPSRNRLMAVVPGRRMNRLYWFRRPASGAC
jgi:SAM-dependent methyltransferase